MDKRRDRYLIGDVDFYHVRNRNELRVLETLRSVLDKKPHIQLDAKGLLDVYAYALNQLMARYAQLGTIVLRDPIKSSHIRTAVEAALDKVESRPKN